ncbi:MAG: class I SAM-dependent methyltransferase [Thermodesulfobacteriota bacterium]
MSNSLTDEEFQTLISLAKKVLWSDATTRRKIQQQRINIIPANFYSNIPLVDDVITSFEYRSEDSEIYNSNIFNRQKIQDFMSMIMHYAYEFSPPENGCTENPEAFFWKNPAFSYSDAMSYYCILRHFKPSHVLEIGSGFSTLVAHEALKKNGSGKLTLIEPYPKEFLKKLDGVEMIIESFVQDIPFLELIELVESADVWFIDSTHTVKVGSDCLYIYLKIMPEISRDIIVHSHDVFLPYALPQKNVLEKHIYWTEQYLLYAYMLDNPKIEVLFGSAYAKGIMPDVLENFMAGKYSGGGGSIWYKLNGASANKKMQEISH